MKPRIADRLTTVAGIVVGATERSVVFKTV
jgi:hypothetical protein